MLQEDSLLIPYETNSLLLEEMEFIQMSQTRMGKVSFVSDFFDDITNAMMIAMYVARKKKYINRVAISETESISFDKEYSAAYTPKHPRWARSRSPS